MTGSNRAAQQRGVGLLLLVLGGTALAASGLQHPPGPLSGRQLYERLLSASAWIHATDCGQGTGFVIDSRRRWLLTNYHVVGDNATAEVWFPNGASSDRTWYLQHRQELLASGQLLTARILRRDKNRDLALLELPQLPAEVTALALARGPATAGDRVHSIGGRYDSPVLWTYGNGSVRQVRTLSEGYFSGARQLARGARVLQVSVPINEGDSGGPLVNDQGEVVGIAAAVAWEHRGEGLCIDWHEIHALLGSSPDVDPPFDTGPRQLYRGAVRSVVLIHNPGSDRRHTGFVLDRDRRLIITTADACGPRGVVELIFPTFRGGELVAEALSYRDRTLVVTGVVLARDSRRNLALVEAASLPEQTVTIRRATDLPQPGDMLHAIGNPDRLDVLWLYSAGCLRQLGRFKLSNEMDDGDVLVLLVQMVQVEGEGGGPLLDQRGELVGVNSGRATPQQQLAYAVPSSELDSFLQDQHARWAPEKAVDFIARAQLFLKARQADRALVDLNAALRQDPTSATACSERSRAHAVRGDLDQALTDSNRAVQLTPRQAAAFSQRAAVYLQRKELKLALADCDHALELDRDNALAYRIRGDTYRLQGNLDRALADLNEALWHDRKSPLTYLARGRLHVRREQWDSALADYNQALSLDPDLAEAYRSRGELFWLRADLQAAQTDFDRALNLTPTDILALLGRARIAQARQQPTSALADLDRALKLDPRLAQAYLVRGSVYLNQDKRLRAWDDFDKALAVDAALAADFLGLIEKDALRQENPQQQIDLYQQSLRRLLPILPAQAESTRLIRTGLAPVPGEDPPATASRLRDLLATIRSKLVAMVPTGSVHTSSRSSNSLSRFSRS